MPTATETFFTELGKRGHEPLLRRVTGSIRFDIGSGRSVQRWVVDIDHGDITVSRRGRGGDCAVQTDTETFDRILEGHDSTMAAYLRGAIGAEGDPELLMLTQRLFSESAPVAAGRG
ncbi:SCP2 sterol-binding domain-containing protein [Catellatospora sp. NPDC049609]|uniref:SCP2 sterol-binding domain-containing protein n=1 Tax=Catellatospora sp. NPDC049609 TaxID=3155505 RepID=UPI00343E4EA7